MMSKPNDFYNKEHYPDPTAYVAITNLECRHSNKVRFVIKLLKKICSDYGYSIENRIILKDEKTGRIFK